MLRQEVHDDDSQNASLFARGREVAFTLLKSRNGISTKRILFIGTAKVANITPFQLLNTFCHARSPKLFLQPTLSNQQRNTTWFLHCWFWSTTFENSTLNVSSRFIPRLHGQLLHQLPKRHTKCVHIRSCSAISFTQSSGLM